MATKAKDRDRELAQSGTAEVPNADVDMDVDDDVGMDDPTGTGQEALGSKVIVIHPGSQNLRIGFANDPLPKTVPMVIARRWPTSESEEGDGEPKPKRLKSDEGSILKPEKMFGQDVRGFQTPVSRFADTSQVRNSVHQDVCRLENSHASTQAQSATKLQRAGCELQ